MSGIKKRFEEVEPYIPGTNLSCLEYIFKTNLIKLRQLLNLNKPELAKAIRLSISYYYRMEDYNVNINPSFEIITIIANFYGIYPYHLFMPSLIDKLSDEEKNNIKNNVDLSRPETIK